MAHELDITNGVASFASAREDAWHRLGTVTENAMTAEEALAAAHLAGWNVRKLPAFAYAEDGTAVPMAGRFAVVRDNPIVAGQVDFLGDLGGAYHPIQNEEHAGLLNALVDESGAHFETAGALRGGKQVFVTMKVPSHMLIGGVDKIDNYIVAVNSHDGSSAFTIMVCPVRVVCANTLNLAMHSTSQKFSVRHTAHATKAIVQQARQALDMTFTYLDEFQAEAERLINTTMTQKQFEEIIAKEFGVPDDAPAVSVTRAENKIAEMTRLFADSYTHEGLRDTAWAGLNALTEWADHYSPVRSKDEDEARALRAVMDPSFKNDAMGIIRRAVATA